MAPLDLALSDLDRSNSRVGVSGGPNFWPNDKR